MAYHENDLVIDIIDIIDINLLFKTVLIGKQKMLEKLDDLKNQIGKPRRFGNTYRNKWSDK